MLKKEYSIKKQVTNLKLIMTAEMNKMKEVLSKYGVVLEDGALNELELVYKKENKKENKKEEKEMLLPYSGVIEEGCCRAMKVNYGLHSQCQTAVKDLEELCAVCKKQSLKKEGVGRIETRQKMGDEYKDKNGKKPLAYVNVMRKQGITSTQVLEYVEKKGVKFDVKHLEEKDKETKKEKKEKEVKRGRPKNAKKEVEVSSTEDLFATLISEAKATASSDVVVSEEVLKELKKKVVKKKVVKEIEVVPEVVKETTTEVVPEVVATTEVVKTTKAPKAVKEPKAAKEPKVKATKEPKAAKAPKEPKAAKEPKVKAAVKEVVATPSSVVSVVPSLQKEEPEESEEGVSVSKIEIKGKTYLKSKNNILYDVKTQDQIGLWNEAKQEIDYSELESESEEEEEEEDL